MHTTHTHAGSPPAAGTRSRQPDVKRIVALAMVVLAAAWLVSFVVSNSKHVTVSFVFADVTLSLIWVMIICAVLGAGLAVAIPRLSRRLRA
jgi:uncharacterized integral membrane protein